MKERQKNLGTNLKIYLAGACYNEPDEGREWRENATKLLKHAAEWVD